LFLEFRLGFYPSSERRHLFFEVGIRLGDRPQPSLGRLEIRLQPHHLDFLRIFGEFGIDDLTFLGDIVFATRGLDHLFGVDHIRSFGFRSVRRNRLLGRLFRCGTLLVDTRRFTHRWTPKRSMAPGNRPGTQRNPSSSGDGLLRPPLHSAQLPRDLVILQPAQQMNRPFFEHGPAHKNQSNDDSQR
jgi:hypothetical protein